MAGAQGNVFAIKEVPNTSHHPQPTKDAFSSQVTETYLPKQLEQEMRLAKDASVQDKSLRQRSKIIQTGYIEPVELLECHNARPAIVSPGGRALPGYTAKMTQTGYDEIWMVTGFKPARTVTICVDGEALPKPPPSDKEQWKLAANKALFQIHSKDLASVVQFRPSTLYDDSKNLDDFVPPKIKYSDG